MGNRQSAASESAGASAPAPGGFGVRVTPGLLNAVAPREEAPRSMQDLNELLQQAYQKGAYDAMQQQAVQQSGERQDKLEEQQRANAQQERELRKRIEALQAREYRAPKMDMMCKEQRQAVLLCYQTMRGAPAGEKVFKCQEAVDDLDRCATLVREAALSKIAQS